MTIRSCVAPLALVFALTILTPISARAAVPIPKPPSVDARGYILIDNGSGRVLADLNADQRMEPASITKLMTAYGVFKALGEKRLQLTDMVVISEHAWRAEGSRTFVQVGTSVPAEVLIKGMIVQSGNDATIALAEKVAGTEEAFVQLMNEYAKRLGMRNSHFTNSSGLPDPAHYSSARDIATLSRAIIQEFPEYYKWYSLREFVWNNIRQQNRNGLLERDPTVDGIKTGHTDSAGYCLVSSAKRDDMRLISVVLGSASMKAREDASAALLNYGYTFYETLHLRKAGEIVLKPRVYKGSSEFIGVAPRQDVRVTIGRGAGGAIHSTARVNEPLIAPLSVDKSVGELTVTDGTDVVARVPLYPMQPVAEGGWWTRLSDTVSLWFN